MLMVLFETINTSFQWKTRATAIRLIELSFPVCFLSTYYHDRSRVAANDKRSYRVENSTRMMQRPN